MSLSFGFPSREFQAGSGKQSFVIYQPLSTTDIEELARLISESFNFPPDKAQPWIERSGVEHWRVLSIGGRILGALLMIPMGQWFGGRAVSMTGLAGVAVSPTARGRGVGQKLIGETLREMKQNGTSLSALYGSTTSFYRRCGYERAGAAYQIEVKLKDLVARAGPLEVRPLRFKDETLVQELQHRWVRGQACLERGPYLWHRVRNPKGEPAEQFGFFRGQTLEGYVFWKRSEFKGTENELEITDLVLTTAAAQETFLGLLAGHRAMYSKAHWLCPSSTPLLLSLHEPWNYKLSLREHWMLRIVDLAGALEARGYPSGAKAELHLEVEDSLLPNSGRFVLKVDGKDAQLESGGEGLIKADMGTMSALYSGFVTATELSVTGRLEGPPKQLELADQVFRGEPRLCDFF